MSFEPSARAVSAPATVIAAGIIWIIVGGLEVLNGALAIAAGAAVGAVIPLLIGAGFLVCGIQTVTAKARDTLGNAIGSIILGALFGGLLLLASGVVGQLGGGGLMVLAMALPIGLVLAGILGLVGRQHYLSWKAAKEGRDLGF